MSMRRELSVGIVAAAMLVNASTPALAHEYDRGYGYGYGHDGSGHHGWGHRRDHVDGGDLVAGIAVIAILAAILSSSSKNKTHVSHAEGNISSEDAAVDACAQAAETKAGDEARVQDITQVDQNSNGWDVEGVIEQRTDWNNNDEGDRHRFTCTVRFGAVQDVTIENGSIALN